MPTEKVELFNDRARGTRLEATIGKRYDPGSREAKAVASVDWTDELEPLPEDFVSLTEDGGAFVLAWVYVKP